ncbi:MAG: [Muribaculaceae bacterium]|nr:[FeFe] hydrogenase H-cluster maturation GTPase HydF [Muribaculaceae bacterium]
MPQSAPSSHRLHITFLGRCNSGKSSLINALAAQQVSIVSDIAGTTTDPVAKPIELPEIGATMIIDTPGFDDTSVLGQQRISQTLKTIDRTDIAVVLFNTDTDFSTEQEIIGILTDRKIPFIGVLTKSDIDQPSQSVIEQIALMTGAQPIVISAATGIGISQLLAQLKIFAHPQQPLITEGMCKSGDTVLLVMPQDGQAPQGRIIKPQVETLRELLDRRCIAICCTPEDMPSALANLATPPQLIITDSQVFPQVYAAKPEQSALTSFSVLFARQKGDITTFVNGAQAMLTLQPTAHILIAEACSHIPQHEDIGRVKLPRLLRQKLGQEINIDIVGGNDFPADLTHYDLVIHCGACMFNRAHVMSRVNRARQQQVPVTNYGIAIAALTGILDKVGY